MSVNTHQYNYGSRTSELDDFEDILDHYKYISGRRFHNTTSKYSLPNDKNEVDRLELSHDLFKYAFGGNYSSPIQNKLEDGIAVLDIGCGTGKWIIDNAMDYPKSTFIGIDMSPIFPKENKPQNAGFIECDVLYGLPFPSNTFDFVHQRLLCTAFSEKQWITVIKEIMRVLKPSGYVEFMESDPLKFHNSGPCTREIMKKVKQFYKSQDICMNVPSKLKGFMESIGDLSEVKVENRVLPVGKWNGTFGELMFEYIRMSIESYSIIITRKFKYTNQESLELLDCFAQEIEGYSSSLSYTRFYAQKI
ncbi:S-adenosyl-L-methionine-dependent methyltransferase [Glomus cerebriforme]|uniref:S-adenosyl-L-methionine-dependent methyltransferase n=1 Tax=Glomus cerebriforme TaxID=658196 RepID=A0A397T6J8_9GLOM|nr:S-adenosyl-L-methionine-dependent methyltransferase [Glomus cerebriforme]